jgi:hypothetical protein
MDISSIVVCRRLVVVDLGGISCTSFFDASEE